MAHYIFVVNVRTDDRSDDIGPNAIRDEILSNLQYEDYRFGIERVTVREVHTLGGYDAATREDS